MRSKTIGIKGKRNPVGICYVIIPGDVNRTKYIKDCFRRGVVTVQFENGSSMLDIPIDIDILQNIEFPIVDDKKGGGLGSCLVYVNEYDHNKPIILGRLLKGDETTNLSENEFKLEKNTENGSVSISGRGDSGNLFINVTGKSTRGGKIYIDVNNDENSGEIIVNLQGNLKMELQSMVLNILKDLNITAVEDINIDTETTINLGLKDEVQATFRASDTITELKKEVQALTDLITSISNIVPVVVPANAIDPTWAAWQLVVATILNRGNFDDVQSSKTFIE